MLSSVSNGTSSSSCSAKRSTCLRRTWARITSTWPAVSEPATNAARRTGSEPSLRPCTAIRWAVGWARRVQVRNHDAIDTAPSSAWKPAASNSPTATAMRASSMSSSAKPSIERVAVQRHLEPLDLLAQSVEHGDDRTQGVWHNWGPRAHFLDNSSDSFRSDGSARRSRPSVRSARGRRCLGEGGSVYARGRDDGRPVGSCP